MTYNVFGGTLSLTLSIYLACVWVILRVYTPICNNNLAIHFSVNYTISVNRRDEVLHR